MPFDMPHGLLEYLTNGDLKCYFGKSTNCDAFPLSCCGFRHMERSVFKQEQSKATSVFGSAKRTALTGVAVCVAYLQKRILGLQSKSLMLLKSMFQT